MRYLIAGGAEFIGSHLGEKFAWCGNRVMGGANSTARIENSEHLRACKLSAHISWECAITQSLAWAPLAIRCARLLITRTGFLLSGHKTKRF